jgi:hypothetical protein
VTELPSEEEGFEPEALPPILTYTNSERLLEDMIRLIRRTGWIAQSTDLKATINTQFVIAGPTHSVRFEIDARTAQRTTGGNKQLYYAITRPSVRDLLVSYLNSIPKDEVSGEPKSSWERLLEAGDD